MNAGALYNLNQLRDYSSLFSRSEVLMWLKKDFSSINYKIERYDAKWKRSSQATYLDYLKYIYSVLESQYQNEYVFKNAFLNDWLIKELGEQDSKIFSEFRVGTSVADLVMFNGCSKIFEIKTEFDSDARLTAQLNNYKKAFNKIYLIVPESKLSIYNKYDKSIGLIVFNTKEKERFRLYRDSEINFEIEAKTVMNILHTNEYKSIVKSYYGELPAINSFNQFDICWELIKEIPICELNKLFIHHMKKRDFENVLSNRYYKEFNQVSLALKMNKIDKFNLIQSLKTPLQY